MIWRQREEPATEPGEIPIAQHARLRRRQAGRHAGEIIALQRLFGQPCVGIVVGQLLGARNCVIHHQVGNRKSLKPNEVDALLWAGKIGGARSGSGETWPVNHKARNPQSANAYATAWHCLNGYGWDRFDELVVRLRRLSEGIHEFELNLAASGEAANRPKNSYFDLGGHRPTMRLASVQF